MPVMHRFSPQEAQGSRREPRPAPPVLCFRTGVPGGGPALEGRFPNVGGRSVLRCSLPDPLRLPSASPACRRPGVHAR
ncbi:hypothetical protein H4V95_002128 [Arthrobacter sp. CAN_C5]|nr:hypothetical protein [Arthrobacter sp. CAN_C5]